MNLSELIESLRDRSYDRLAERTPGVLSGSGWHRFATEPLTDMPSTARIKAIAQVLGVDEMTVLLACAESTGIDVARAQGPFDNFPTAARDLTDGQLSSLRAVVREYIALNQPAMADSAVVDLSSVRNADQPLREPSAVERGKARKTTRPRSGQ